MTSNYLGNRILDFLFGGVAYTPPATYHMALFTVMPLADGTGGTEVAGGNYGRVGVANNATNFPAAVGKTKSNGAAVTFPMASASWGSVAGIVVMDAATGGNIHMISTFASPRPVAANDTLSFNAGQLTFTAV